ncbi:polysaccharide deacetylase family protein [Sediminibacillus albus]|uniref:Probable sporulation protein, polysaccharide deacetylase family n=1 Tax=Sediminibacillus albus TaxID=407036 RepID=A0A1G8W037_9BACI|nr:polysaccharide deacetylase family protein [Sediminibacillus albus]SDJ71477.1 probable sporulation protein, polysaccharide deacetylase family [Sediminibacillus albus]
MKRLVIHFLLFVFLLAAFFPVKANPFQYHYLASFSEDAEVSGNVDDLRNRVEKEAIKNRVEPEDARIDKVWKKIPGRNGLKVNIDKSLEKMSKKGAFDKSLLVMEQVPPKITFDDLPAAPVYRGHPEKNMVSLLINVAWGTENIPSMLKTLKKMNVKANFFIEGKWASQNADIVQMIQEEGHIVGNHAYNHPDMSRLSPEENREQLEQTNDIIKAITGKAPKWFAPPSGSFNSKVVDLAAELEMETVLWSVDTIDWQKPSVEVMINRVSDQIHPGAMILMHPTEVINNGLERLILLIKQKNFKIGTIERLLSEQR